MSNEYPDVLGDLIDAQQRFEVNGVHYVMALQPTTIAPGQMTALHIWLQNCWDVPVEVAITLQLPTHSASVLSILQTQTIGGSRSRRGCYSSCVQCPGHTGRVPSRSDDRY